MRRQFEERVRLQHIEGERRRLECYEGGEAIFDWSATVYIGWARCMVLSER